MSESHTEVKPGFSFQVACPASTTPAELRKQARERYQLDVFIKMKIGPYSMEGTELKYPIQAVDGEVLDVSWKGELPAPGQVIYVGTFKELEPVVA